jgi:hypothetical protein
MFMPSGGMPGFRSGVRSVRESSGMMEEGAWRATF